MHRGWPLMNSLQTKAFRQRLNGRCHRIRNLAFRSALAASQAKPTSRRPQVPFMPHPTTSPITLPPAIFLPQVTLLAIFPPFIGHPLTPQRSPQVGIISDRVRGHPLWASHSLGLGLLRSSNLRASRDSIWPHTAISQAPSLGHLTGYVWQALLLSTGLGPIM